ncbi:MAG: nucleotidyltransferase family protein [Chloroflexota bacterium]|nr:nucleotidyltransferase family protein [Chloroflexota bacterium]
MDATTPTSATRPRLEDLVRLNRDEILEIARRHGAGNVRVFGSVARGESGPDSDLDLLYDVVGPTTPWFPGGLLVDLEALLGRPVDVVEAQALHRRIRDRVLAEARSLSCGQERGGGER